MVWKGSTMLAWVLFGCISLAQGRKGFENPMIDAGTLTFIAMARDNIHHIPNPVNIHGQVPAASIIARTPSPPPVDFLEEPYIPPSQTNFSVYLTHDKPFDLCFFLNLNIPSYPEAPDFRVRKGNAVVVENADFKRLARKVEDQRRRMAEGDLPTLEELNELPSEFYPLKDLSERCVKSNPMGSGHLVNCDVEVDYPLRLFGTPIPLVDLTVVSDSNRANVSEIVEQMRTGMEHGLEMVRKFGPPLPPMMPPFAQPPPPPPPAAAAVPFTAPFPGMTRTENNDNNRYADNNRNAQQTQAQPNQWRPFGSQVRQPGNQWMTQRQGPSGNMPMRAY